MAFRGNGLDAMKVSPNDREKSLLFPEATSGNSPRPSQALSGASQATPCPRCLRMSLPNPKLHSASAALPPTPPPMVTRSDGGSVGRRREIQFIALPENRRDGVRVRPLGHGKPRTCGVLCRPACLHASLPVGAREHSRGREERARARVLSCYLRRGSLRAN